MSKKKNKAPSPYVELREVEGPTIESLAAKIVDEASVFATAAEQILFETPKDVPLSSRQLAVLRVAGIDGADAVESERYRVGRVKERMREAGSSADLAAAEEAFRVADGAWKTESDELQSKISALEQRVRTLEANRAEALKRLDVMHGGRRALRDQRQLPRHVCDDYNRARKMEVTQTRHRISCIETELGVIEAIEKMSPSSEEARSHAEAAERERERVGSAEKLFVETRGGQWRSTQTGRWQNEEIDPKTGVVANEFHGWSNRKLDVEAWKTYVKRRVEVERPALLKELEVLRPALEQAEAHIGKLLDFYIEQLG